MGGPTLPITAPTRAPRLGGIRSVAEFRPNDRLNVAEAIVFQSQGCTFPYTEVNRCYAADPVPDKTFTGIEIEDAVGAPFTMVAGVACFIAPDADELERAKRILADGQDRVLEENYEAWLSAGTELDAGGDVVRALATVEQALDDQYVGRGIIAMSRFDIILADAAGSIERNGDGAPTTINGTPILASGRFVPGTVYGSGAVVVEHGETVAHEAYDFENNMHYALAEAQFALAVDCEFRVKSSVVADAN